MTVPPTPATGQRSAEQVVSILPSDMDPDGVEPDYIAAPATHDSPVGLARDFVEILTGYENPASREHRYNVYGCPLYLRRSLEVFAHSPRAPAPPRSLDATLALSLEEGARLLLQVPGLKQIRTARLEVLASGDDRIIWFDDWRFDLALHHQGRKNLYGRVLPEVTRQISLIAQTLGLSSSTVACLAIECVLIHVPDIPDHHKEVMATELESFIVRVGERATQAAAIAASVTPSRTTLSLTFADLLDRHRERE